SRPTGRRTKSSLVSTLQSSALRQTCLLSMKRSALPIWMPCSGAGFALPRTIPHPPAARASLLQEWLRARRRLRPALLQVSGALQDPSVACCPAWAAVAAVPVVVSAVAALAVAALAVAALAVALDFPVAASVVPPALAAITPSSKGSN